MESGDKEYLWQRPDWPKWRYDGTRLAGQLAKVHHAQGLLIGRMRDLGLGLRDQANLRVLTEDVLKTSEIEGERLDPDTVRSLIARRLGVDVGVLAPADRHVDGVVDMVLDSTGHFDQELTSARLFGWHAALFPTGYSGLARIRTGDWRDDASGPMQVVSGPVGRQKVHYEAPPAHLLEAEVSHFLTWFNDQQEPDPVAKAGLASLDSEATKRLDALSTALARRPALRLEVEGKTDAEKDAEGLRRVLFERKVKARKAEELAKTGTPAPSVDEVVVSKEEWPVYLKQAYGKERFPKPRTALGFVKDIPPDEMEKLIRANVMVSPDDLRQLALDRASVVKEFLLGPGRLATDCVFLVDPAVAAQPKPGDSFARAVFVLR
jgi:hypothetical protein